eukprot:GHVU01047293.1.p2 GENE.GHVU01047293.1~~GHVU01047293.1.p2  ORF type:complete len:119 (+),score=7.95 GHVU01047293.1:451-807(+)
MSTARREAAANHGGVARNDKNLFPQLACSYYKSSLKYICHNRSNRGISSGGILQTHSLTPSFAHSHHHSSTQLTLPSLASSVTNESKRNTVLAGLPIPSAKLPPASPPFRLASALPNS